MNDDAAEMTPELTFGQGPPGREFPGRVLSHSSAPSRARSWRSTISCAPPTISPIMRRCRRRRSLRCSIASKPGCRRATPRMRSRCGCAPRSPRASLSPKHAQDLIAAFKLDVTKLRYRDWDDLISYCSLSAMPVGRFVCDVHGESRAVWPANDALCAALQIINHLQDCKDDYRNLDRVYIPQDALAASGSSVEALGAERASPALLDCLHQLAARTERLLSESDGFAAAINDRRLGLEVSVINTLAHRLTRILRARDPLSEQVHLGDARGRRLYAARHFARRLAPPRPAAFRRRAQAAGCVSERDRHRPPRAPPAARSIPGCGSCRAPSARRCSKSMRSAAPSTTSPTIRARASRGARRWRNGAAISTRSMPARRRRTSPAWRTRCATSICSARIFSPSSTAWRWTCVADIRAPDRATLDLYCDRVACAVGRLSVRVFGMEREAGLALAHHLGRALQLTNILRDLDEDAAIGRLYLPREALHEAGITATDPAAVLAASGDRQSLRRHRRAGARPNLQSANAIMAQSPRRIVRAPRIMGEAYRLILDRLIARGFAPPRAPVRLPRGKIPSHRAAQSSCDGPHRPHHRRRSCRPVGRGQAQRARPTRRACTRRPLSPAAAAAPITTPRSA